MNRPFDPADLSALSSSEPDRVEPSTRDIERVNRELQMRADPGRVAPSSLFDWPWSPGARVRTKAQDLSLEARLESFRDDLRSIRIANEVLNRAVTMRAVEAAEAAIFEIRCLGEAARFTILNRTQLDMSRQFVRQLEILESFRASTSPEVVDALKERALHDFTLRMNRLGKCDFEFSRQDILKLKP